MLQLPCKGALISAGYVVHIIISRWTYNAVIRRHKCPIAALYLFPRLLPVAY